MRQRSRTEKIIAVICGGISIGLGFILVLLDITGVVDWKGTLPGVSFAVTTTHVGIAFGLIGMCVLIIVVLKGESTRTTTTRAWTQPTGVRYEKREQRINRSELRQ